MKIRLLIIIVISAVLSTACRSGKTVAEGGSSAAYVSSDPSKALGERQLKELLSGLEASYGAWSDVKVPVTLSLKSPKKMSVSGTLTMQRDRSIHLSFRFLGMEVASLMVTNDSIYALYKLERLYFAESIRNLMGGFPATVGNVQDLILGRAFVLGDRRLTASSCRLAGNGREWTITPGNSPAGMSYDFAVDTPTGNVESLTVTLPSRKPIVASYSDFFSSAAGPVASLTRLSASTSKRELSGELIINPRKADWDRGNTKTWTTPRGYTRVKAADIMKMLSKF